LFFASNRKYLISAELGNASDASKPMPRHLVAEKNSWHHHSRAGPSIVAAKAGNLNGDGRALMEPYFVLERRVPNNSGDVRVGRHSAILLW